ncbi:MAG: hypothetical protein V3R54_09190 [Thermodesulfovibrionia bacterium]
MNRIVIGTNVIEDCENAIIISGKPLFSYRLDNETMLFSFNVSSPQATTVIQIKDNVIQKGKVTLKADSKSVTVKLGNLLLMELLIKGDTAHVNLDLRPLGLHIYTDKNALHVGGSQLSENTIKQCTNGIEVG